MVHDVRYSPIRPKEPFDALGAANALSVLSGLALLALQVFSGPFSYYIGLILLGLALLAAWAFLALSCLFSLGLALWSLFRKNPKGLMPLAVNAGFFAVCFFVPLSEPYLDYNFFEYHDARMRFIEAYQSGALDAAIKETGGLRGFDVPDGYPNISAGNYVFLEKNAEGAKVLFFTGHGVTDNYSGLLYISGGRKPGARELGGDVVWYEEVARGWFYVVFT